MSIVIANMGPKLFIYYKKKCVMSKTHKHIHIFNISDDKTHYLNKFEHTKQYLYFVWC